MRENLVTIVVATLCALVLEIADGWSHHHDPAPPPAFAAAPPPGPTLH